MRWVVCVWCVTSTGTERILSNHKIHVRLRRINVTPKIPTDLYRSSRTTPGGDVFFDQTATRQRLPSSRRHICAGTSRRLQRRVQRRVAGRRLAGARRGEAAQRQQVRAYLPRRLARLRVPRHRLADQLRGEKQELVATLIDEAAQARPPVRPPARPLQLLCARGAAGPAAAGSAVGAVAGLSTSAAEGRQRLRQRAGHAVVVGEAAQLLGAAAQDAAAAAADSKDGATARVGPRRPAERLVAQEDVALRHGRSGEEAAPRPSGRADRDGVAVRERVEVSLLRRVHAVAPHSRPLCHARSSVPGPGHGSQDAGVSWSR